MGAPLLAALAFACSASPSDRSAAATASTATSTTIPTLHGTYVPAPGATNAEYRALTFFDASGYFAYRAGCTGAACRTQGTYTFDGAHALVLTDGASGAVERLGFSAVAAGNASSQARDLVVGSGSALVDAGSSGAGLVTPVLEALMNGVLMQLFGANDDGGAVPGYCEPPDGAQDCALQDRVASKNADGSCSCIVRPTGTAYRVPVTLLHGGNGTLYPTVKLSVAGGPVLTAILDTGSTGLWLTAGSVPADVATPIARIPYGWGADLSVTGRLESVPSVTLAPDAADGGVLSNGPVVVSEITAIDTCPAGDACTPDTFKFNQSFDAVLGVGLRQTGQLVSPMASFGTTSTFLVSLDGYGLTTGHLTIDPVVSRLRDFTASRAQLLPDGHGGWRDDDLPFCVNSFCSGGAAGKGLLLDSGNTPIVMVPAQAADYATLGVSPAAAAQLVPPGTAVTVTIGTTDPSGNDTSPTWSFPVGAPPTAGLDRITVKPSAVGNNLGIAAFYRFDVLYDLGLGQIGLSAKSVTRICDVKRSLSATLDAGTTLTKQEEALTEANYQTVLDGLSAQLGCTVLRVYIDPGEPDSSAYPPLYVDTVAYARSLGMRIYANPLATGLFQFTDADGNVQVDAYAQWILSYASAFHPDYLGPFNESSLKEPSDIEAIADEVYAGVAGASLLVGPDAQQVKGTEKLLGLVPSDAGVDPNLPAHFDIFSSHDANDDEGATALAWSALAASTARPLWSSENPRAFSFQDGGVGPEVGVTAAVQGGVAAVVIYDAFPAAVDDTGALTSKGQALASGIP
jgi:hypothetical protein